MQVGISPNNNSSLIPRDPDEIIAYCGDGPKSVADLTAQARLLAERLPEGRYTINLYTNRYQYLLGFCASMMAGHVTLMPPNRQPDVLAEIEQLYPGSYRLEDEKKPGSPMSGQANENTLSVDDRSPSIIAFTSGSTAKPAATRKNWHTLRVSTERNHAALLAGVEGTPNLVATVPCQHMWGFETTVLMPLLCNATINYKHPLYPGDIATALAETPSPAVLISSPVHLRALKHSGVETPPLSRILTATAPLSAEEASELEDHFQCEVLDAFGCTESGVIATRRTASEPDWTLLPGFSLNPTEQNTEIHANHLPESVSLPDQLELTGTQSFRWLGRNQDIINIAGKRGSLADLNTRLTRIDGVRDGVIFQAPGSSRLAAMVVAPDLEARDIMESLGRSIEPVFMPRPFLMVDELPRQATGKLSRDAVVEMFESIRGERAGNQPGSLTDT